MVGPVCKLQWIHCGRQTSLDVPHDELLKALHESLRHDTDDFFGTATMKHVGRTLLSVRTSTSWSVCSLSTLPEMLSDFLLVDLA